jgi:transcription-repair coupling factor (superfamily II helicase)
VIVDEEQRFGVEHKEQLKQTRANVDVLTMSATPIPRTLEMAVTGIREMSTIQTPPEERHPVLTFVGPYEEKQISAAIRRELLREGQAFYIHNRVESIDRAASRLRALVPEARIATAHGQMNEHVLEKLIVDFWNKEYDVLVCTTIVESGIDITNANTLIVERAENFGLAQLHQLRGRVGRGAHESFCILLADPATDEARRRLDAMASTSDGFELAEVDLELRGEGTVLAAKQSGIPELRHARLTRHRDLAAAAREEAAEQLATDADIAGATSAIIAAATRRTFGDDVDWLAQA